ncbi:acyl-CoA dehydrogenase family protein [Quisquiliibacterium transsilvanicum]|uniref:Alkylation response protein AidB-like acyl-CoA dehydrogenase n=1 Tax=Quisquiliibacterium transsilvanicum TaxID=1549638 RepID=A0A7W8HF98_9BURK|nr:acyl-CoA dehydrogenase family protein [Quisquiliibacterium transsilvanicum]MBB5270135.1 alkylation response protein AidB-like acyl-CoA dehydrogenase [Quisquiliibacterium transsilvanicum]
MLPALEIERIPDEDEALRPAIRAFLDAELPGTSAAQRSRSWMGYDEEFSRKLARAGFVGMMLPREYGGAARSPFARFVVVEELLARGAPVAAHWIADRQSGPLINRFGTESQRQFYLPRICRGEAFFCIGMSEPDSGSDLASVRTRAVPVDGGWKLNGSKIWTTIAHHAHYMIALVRTSGTPEDRQKGLSQLVIDLKAPGVKVRPICDLAGDEHFNEVHFEDVMLPADALVGAEGAGWAQVNAELAFERSGPERLQSSIVLFDELIAWQRARGAIDAVAAAEIGAIQARLVALRAMCLAVNGKVARGEQPLLEAAVVKDLGTEVEQAIGTIAARLCGADPTDPPPASLMAALAYVLQLAPTFSLRGGTREILRGMIARGLGLR